MVNDFLKIELLVIWVLASLPALLTAEPQDQREFTNWEGDSDNEELPQKDVVPRTYREKQIESEREYFSNLEVLNKIKPVFPVTVLNLGITKGFANVVFIVDETGQQRDMVVASATHSAFGVAAIKAIQKWDYIPLQVDGKPQSCRVKVEVDYEHRGGGTSIRPISINKALQSFEREIPLFDHYTVILGQLDHKPKLINDVSPVYPESLRKAKKSGLVVIDFFIDPTGNVRAPGIKMATNKEFAIAALVAVKEWKFDPPMKEGKPTHARVNQRFSFSNISVDY